MFFDLKKCEKKLVDKRRQRVVMTMLRISNMTPGDPIDIVINKVTLTF